LALAAVSAAMFALPAVASAGTPTIDPGGTSFSGTFGLSTLGAEGEPTIRCEGENHVTGTFNNAGGNATGGTITLDYTNCHIIVLGFTIKCKTAGAPLENTIALSNVPFDLTYATDNKTSPALLVTNVNTTVICGMTTPIVVTGNVMGTVTAPGCGVKSKSASIAFEQTGNVQKHMQITGTGTKFDLLAETEKSGVKRTAGLQTSATVTLNEGKEATLTCV
jgi:hypothetical protein